MRVSRKTWPRPSSSILAPITMRLFCAWTVVGFFCALAQMTKIAKRQGTILARRIAGKRSDTVAVAHFSSRRSGASHVAIIHGGYGQPTVVIPNRSRHVECKLRPLGATQD